MSRAVLRRGALLLLALLCLALPTANLPARALDRDQRQRALLATVQVIVPDRAGRPFSTGSGTVLDAGRGYILTNFHVLGDTTTGVLFNAQADAVIGVNPTNLRGAPILKYRARLLQGDPQIDLAVLQITAPFDNPTGPLPANLGLVDVQRGVSTDLLIGDPIYVLGFPGLGGDTVTYTTGTVSGFLDEDRNGVEEWIKTDAEVNRGNSGGLALNDAGLFIGVPSAGRTDAEAAGKISLIRPGDLALEYFDRWTAAGTAGAADPTAPRVTDVRFGAAVDGEGRALQGLTPFGSLSGSPLTTLYASFDALNLPASPPLTYLWTLDGRSVATGMVEAGQANGPSMLQLSNESGLMNGLYMLQLLLGSQSLYRGSVVVGAASESVALGPITFARDVTADGAPVQPAAAFAGTDQIVAIFAAQGLQNGVLLRSTWRHNGGVVLDDEAPWTQGEVSTAWLSIAHPGGLPVGEYELQIDIDGRRAQVGAFQITEKQNVPSAATVNVVGAVRDAANSRRIVLGAAVFLLQPGVTLDDWVNARFDERLIYARGSSQDDGSFALDRRVETGRAYAVLVIHEEYKPAREAAWVVPAGATDPFPLDVELSNR